MPLNGRPLANNTPVDVANLLGAGLAQHPDGMAMASAKGRWTWRELDAASSRHAANLFALGVRKGDRVASLMPNRIALAIHYLGCMKAGYIAVPLNYRYMPPEIDYALSLTEPKVVVAHAERDADLAAASEVGNVPFGVIRYGAGGGEGSVEAMQVGETPVAMPPAPKSTDPVVIFFTSGSTGKPKGVTHTFETLGWMLRTCIEGYEIQRHDVILAGSSLSHLGAYVHSFMAMAHGGGALVARTHDPAEILGLLRRHSPSVLVMLPSALFRLVRDHGATHADFASLRLCFSGGDKVASELEREFTDLVGSPVDEAYGMSEIGISNLNPPSGLMKHGSVGPANFGFSLSIRDDDGREVSVGKEGRLWVKSPVNMVGYWNNPEETDKCLVDGWLDTGDLMRADEDGYLWFCGRRKHVIVHDGSNICPQEVEESIMEHPRVESAGVVGVHDLVHGENVRAYVVLSEGATPLKEQELIEFSRARVGYKAPESIEFLEEMPYNATGKVDRGRLKEWAAEQNPHRLSVAYSAPYQDALERCLEHWGLEADKTELVRDGANHVFASKDMRGRPVIIRVSDGSIRQRSEIEGELAWLNHLRMHGCTVSTPIRSRNGALVETSELSAGTFHVSCFVRFGGRLLDPKTDPEWNDELLEELGREIAKVHRVSDTLTLPPEHDRKPWDEWNVLQIPDPVPAGLDPAVCEAMQVFIHEMRGCPKQPRHYGLVHGDLHAGNFLYENGAIELIDFDLGGYGWRVMDLVTLLFIHYYFPSKRVPDASPPRAREVLSALVRGYRRESTLDPEQLDAINELMKLRSILNYVAMAPAPDHWQIALGNPTPTVRESLRWIERIWTDGVGFGLDNRGR